MPLNTYVSLNKPIFENESESTYIDIIQEGEVLNPETLFIGRENRSFIESQIIKNLSRFETKVLSLYLQGRSYFEIAQVINKSEKSIDNALQRVKKKIEKCLKGNDKE